jgi:hypothetical protein
MTNYNKGKIYKLEPICEYDEGDIYIGSTTKEYLCQRMTAHKYDYKKYKQGSKSKVMSFDIFDKYGPENVKITLIELVNANSKDELTKRERFYIESTDCVNKCVPGMTSKEYYLIHKDKLIKYRNEYNDANRVKIKEQNKKTPPRKADPNPI